MRKKCRYLLFLILVGLLLADMAAAARLKDIAHIKGVRSNQLVGYGLVVGLAGTGDDTKKGKFASEAMANMLDKFGISVDAATIDLDNAAAVMLTAELPPFSRNGSRLDVLVSSIGDAKSLQGGTLMLTPLRGPDGRVYAMAQGAVSVGGFSLGGGGGGQQTKNHSTVGRIANGAMIEREPPSTLFVDGKIVLTLNMPDFMTVSRIAKAINETFEQKIALPVDSGTIEVTPPSQEKEVLIPFLAVVENLQVTPDTRARVVIDERTGTVVVGRNVMLDAVAVAHGDLSIQISAMPIVSQPPPFSQGTTVVGSEKQVEVVEEPGKLVVMPRGVNIDVLVKALNSIGVSPRDLIAIFQAIKASGALHAELEII
ncbi:MAG: flagellar basal body P-ring protein FlgI [Deltaproteobacteria bacterium]|nr:flagellar basal body P-ring protein FlgI [Deltaproteobacteria bacterium]